MEPSIARKLFDQMTASGEAASITYIESLVKSTEKTFEGQNLEFKSGKVQNPGDAWSRSLSAFANTDGGVVVWGIGTKREHGVDHAASLEKVATPLALKGELEKHLQHGTDPLTSGVEIQALPSSGDPGFVVCFIPESTYKPHRAVLCQGHPYFGRFGHRTDIIPTAWLRRLFFPEKSLRLVGRIDVVATDDIESKWQINGFIENQGATTAESMFVRVVSNRICKFHAMGEWQLLKQDQRGRTFESGSDGYEYVKDREYYAEMRSKEPLHPGNEAWPFQIVEIQGLVRSGMAVEITVFAHDQAPVSVTLEISQQIHSQIAAETKHGQRATIHLQPHLELRPLR